MSFPLLVEVFCLFLTVEFPEPRIVPGKLTGTSDMYGMNELFRMLWKMHSRKPDWQQEYLLKVMQMM